jgi:hypothetical protein
MLGNSFRRKVVLLLLCSVLVAPWASAAGSRAQDRLQNPLDLFSRALSFLQGIWSTGEIMPPQEPPRASRTGALVPVSEAGEIPPPKDPPILQGSPGPALENPNPNG